MDTWEFRRKCLSLSLLWYKQKGEKFPTDTFGDGGRGKKERREREKKNLLQRLLSLSFRPQKKKKPPALRRIEHHFFFWLTFSAEKCNCPRSMISAELPNTSLPDPQGHKTGLQNPTNNALLINFWLSSDARIFVNKHRPSIQIGAKRAKNVYAMCTFSNGASILHTTVGGWEHSSLKAMMESSSFSEEIGFHQSFFFIDGGVARVGGGGTLSLTSWRKRGENWNKKSIRLPKVPCPFLPPALPPFFPPTYRVCRQKKPMQ